MTNQDRVLKSRVLTLLTKVHIVKAMVFPLVMYGWESWTMKKGWALKNRCFWTVVLEKTFESPLNHKEIKLANPKWNSPWTFIGRIDDEVEAPILCPPDANNRLIKKTLMLGKTEGKRRRGYQRIRWLNSIPDSMDINLRKFQEIVEDSEAWRAAVYEVAESNTTQQLNNKKMPQSTMRKHDSFSLTNQSKWFLFITWTFTSHSWKTHFDVEKKQLPFPDNPEKAS